MDVVALAVVGADVRGALRLNERKIWPMRVSFIPFAPNVYPGNHLVCYVFEKTSKNRKTEQKCDFDEKSYYFCYMNANNWERIRVNLSLTLECAAKVELLKRSINAVTTCEVVYACIDLAHALLLRFGGTLPADRHTIEDEVCNMFADLSGEDGLPEAGHVPVRKFAKHA